MDADRRRRRRPPRLELLEGRLALSAPAHPLAAARHLAALRRSTPAAVGTTAPTGKVGDINGDGQVNLNDLQAFAPAYLSHAGDGFYNPAADFNHNGFIGQEDAKVLVRQLAPITPHKPLNVRLTLAPGDYARNTLGFETSGGVTQKQSVTILGRTTPNSAIFADSGLGDYSFTGAFVPTDANGNFALKVTNKEGLNNYEFLVIDPFGHQRIRAFPVFWIPFAQLKLN